MLLMADPVFTSDPTSVLHADPDIEGCWARYSGIAPFLLKKEDGFILGENKPAPFSSIVFQSAST
jgi:hypothetical protein